PLPPPPPPIPTTFPTTNPTNRIAIPDLACPQKRVKILAATRPHAPSLSPAISPTCRRCIRA
ncbi:hypothetical protein A2U01_0070985, partial [Trifolium medium]|nr:hypothetical protein [Trifolium medium]